MYVEKPNRLPYVINHVFYRAKFFIMMKKYLKYFKYLAAGLFLAYGRYPVSWILSRGKTQQKPKVLIARKTGYLSAPSGNRLLVQVDGNENGTPIILVHGLNSSSQQWFYQRLMLQKQYKLILIDLPGHGKSGKPVDLSISTLAQDLRLVLETLGLSNFILYGHSLGAMIILEYLKRWQSTEIKAVILQHGSFTNPLKSCLLPNFMRKVEYPFFRPLLESVIRYPTVFKWLARINYRNGLSMAFYRFLLFTGRQSPSQLRYLSSIAAKCPIDVLAAGVLQALNFDAEEILPEIETPLLAIGAVNDRIINADALRIISTTVKNGKFEEIAGGHQSMIEFPISLNRILKRYLDSLG